MAQSDNSAWGYRTVRQRYEGDVAFSALVDMMLAHISEAKFTPTEIREAAMLAQIIYEETHVRPSFFTIGDIAKGRV